MFYTFRIVCFSLLVLFSRGAVAIDGCLAPVDEEQQKTAVYYINGIWTSEADAELNREYLAVTFRNFQILPTNTLYQKIYNPTAGKLRDLAEVFAQKTREKGINQGEMSDSQFLRTVLSTTDTDSLSRMLKKTLKWLGVEDSTLESISTSILDQIDEVRNSISEAIREQLETSGVDTTSDKYRGVLQDALATGRRVIVVPHSQGNLFALQAVRRIVADNTQYLDNIAVMGIASPAAASTMTEGFYSYITGNDDRVINALRGLGHDVLPSNIDNSGEGTTFWLHFFIEDYLAVDAPMDWIRDRVRQLDMDLSFPLRRAGEGALRATLTWGAQPDVDLHAYEPNGAHVYYRRKRGVSGTLDVDDVTSYGPENYVVECDSIEVGTYRIGVNYYAGEGPETAEVRLYLGDGRNARRDAELDTPRYSQGDSSPTILFEVVVTETNGRAEYMIR